MQHQVALAKLAMRSRSTLFENFVEIILSGVIQGILTSQSADIENPVGIWVTCGAAVSVSMMIANLIKDVWYEDAILDQMRDTFLEMLSEMNESPCPASNV